MSLNHVRTSGLRSSRKDPSDGRYTVTCDVHYPDGSVAVVSARRTNRIAALRAMLGQVRMIDDAETPTGKLRKALLLHQSSAA